MLISIYKCNDEYNKINKVLPVAINVTGNLTENSSIINPIITIEYNENILEYNYCYVPAFKRYYYINNIIVKNKTLELHLHVDVLKSFSNDILNSKALITRSNIGNRYLADNLARTLADTKVTVRNLGTGLSAGVSYIMVKGK